MKDYLVVCNKNTKKISKLIYKKLKINFVEINIIRFRDTEVILKFNRNFRNKKVIIIYPMIKPFGNCIFELLLLINTVKNLYAKKIILFSFYFAYSRQDKVLYKENTSVALKLLMDLLSKAGVSNILTFDIHSLQTISFFKRNVENFTLFPSLINKIENFHKKFTIIFPDVGCYNKYKCFLKDKIDYFVINKSREGSKIKISCDFKKKLNNKIDYIIVDDIVDSGRTIINASKFIKKNGAKKVFLYAIHPVLSDFKNFVKKAKFLKIKKINFFNTLFLKESFLENVNFLNFDKEIIDVIKNQIYD